MNEKEHFTRVINAGETFPVCYEWRCDSLKKYQTRYSAFTNRVITDRVKELMLPSKDAAQLFCARVFLR